jgi:hypothetical protein
MSVGGMLPLGSSMREATDRCQGRDFAFAAQDRIRGVARDVWSRSAFSHGSQP